MRCVRWYHLRPKSEGYIFNTSSKCALLYILLLWKPYPRSCGLQNMASIETVYTWQPHFSKEIYTYIHTSSSHQMIEVIVLSLLHIDYAVKMINSLTLHLLHITIYSSFCTPVQSSLKLWHSQPFGPLSPLETGWGCILHDGWQKGAVLVLCYKQCGIIVTVIRDWELH